MVKAYEFPFKVVYIVVLSKFLGEWDWNPPWRDCVV